MIAVVNYGAGNLPNVVRALQHVGAHIHITDNPQEVREAPAVVLPGVGATRDTMHSLASLGLIDVIKEIATSGKPFLGICVGMQVLCTTSEEFGTHDCLNIIPGVVRRLPDGEKIPQIGWNSVDIADTNHPLFANIPQSSYFYFVHSYYCDVAARAQTIIAGETTYTCTFPSIFLRGSLAATQFHPEKSGKVGLQLLRNFVALCQHA